MSRRSRRLRDKLFISTGAVGQFVAPVDIFPSRFSISALLSAAVLRGAFLGVPSERAGCRGTQRAGCRGRGGRGARSGGAG